MIIVVSPVVDTGGQLVAMATPVSYCRGRVHQSLLAQTGEQHTTQRGCALVASWADLSLSLTPSFCLSLSAYLPLSNQQSKTSVTLLSIPLPRIEGMVMLSTLKTFRNRTHTCTCD